jgi:hypothetical protein
MTPAFRPANYEGMPRHDYRKAGAWVRRRFPLSKQDHLDLANEWLDEAHRLDREYGRHVDRELRLLASRGVDPGPLISGIVSEHFPDRVKDGLRQQVRAFNALRDAAMGHFAASGKRHSTFLYSLQRRRHG